MGGVIGSIGVAPVALGALVTTGVAFGVKLVTVGADAAAHGKPGPPVYSDPFEAMGADLGRHWAEEAQAQAVEGARQLAVANQHLQEAVHAFNDSLANDQTNGERIIRGFHGTNGDNVLSILNSGELRPSGGKIFLSKNLSDSFVHGGDLARKANFSIDVSVVVPKDASVEYTSKPGNPATILIHTNTPAQTQVNALHVRERDGDEFVHSKVDDPAAIRGRLQ